MKKTIVHRRTGCKVHLDSSQHFPEDPGQGTPVVVEYKRGTATYNYALGTGCVYTEDGADIDIPHDAMEWLQSQAVDAEIDAMYEIRS